MQRRQLAQNLLGAFVLDFGRLEHHFDDLVAALILASVEDALFAQTELLAVLRALRHFEQRASVDGGHFDFGAQSGLSDGDRHLNPDVVAIAMEEGVRFAIREGGRTVGAGVVAKIIA